MVWEKMGGALQLLSGRDCKQHRGSRNSTRRRGGGRVEWELNLEADTQFCVMTKRSWGGVARMECKTLEPARGRGDNRGELLPRSSSQNAPRQWPWAGTGWGHWHPSPYSCPPAPFPEVKTARTGKICSPESSPHRRHRVCLECAQNEMKIHLSMENEGPRKVALGVCVGGGGIVTEQSFKKSSWLVFKNMLLLNSNQRKNTQPKLSWSKLT